MFLIPLQQDLVDGVVRAGYEALIGQKTKLAMAAPTTTEYAKREAARDDSSTHSALPSHRHLHVLDFAPIFGFPSVPVFMAE